VTIITHKPSEAKKRLDLSKQQQHDGRHTPHHTTPHTPAHLGHARRLVLPGQPALVPLPVGRDMLGVSELELLERGDDVLEAVWVVWFGVVRVCRGLGFGRLKLGWVV